MRQLKIFIRESVALAASEPFKEEFYHMKQRIITGTAILIALIVVVIFSWTPILPALVSLCAVIAVYEMARCIGMSRAHLFTVPLYLCAAVFPILNRYLTDAEILRRVNFITIVVALFYFFAIMTFSHGKYSIENVSVLFTTSFFIMMGFTSIVVMYSQRGEAGHLLYLTIFIGAWITDVFAYFCGMLFGRGGKHKLIPDVSPKKTVEGSIGGIAFCILAMVIFGIVVEAVSSYEANLIALAFAGLVISVVAQIGDLLMSVIKRTYGIKDYGKIFPGHGGILDRFDSILAVSIVLMVFTSFFDLLR
jgi:phosphatidate cytidylyltransferase